MTLDKIIEQLELNRNQYIRELESAYAGGSATIGNLKIIWLECNDFYVFCLDGERPQTKYGQVVYGDSYGRYYRDINVSELKEVQLKTKTITYYE